MEFILVYGPFVGLLATFVLAAAVVGTRLLWARAEVDRLGRDESPHAAWGLEEGLRTVSGTLLAEGRPVEIDPSEPSGIVSAVMVGTDHGAVAAQGLFLEVEGKCIPLKGEVELAWGSTVKCSGARLASLSPWHRGAIEAVLVADPEDTWDHIVDAKAKLIFMTLDAGDRVEVTAHFERCSEQGRGDYRSVASIWEATGGGEHPPISLRFAGQAKIRVRTRKSSFGLGAFALAVGLVCLYGFGEHAMDDLPRA